MKQGSVLEPPWQRRFKCWSINLRAIRVISSDLGVLHHMMLWGAGMAVFDTMRHIRPDVSTVCVGLAASMGAFLLASGHQVSMPPLPLAQTHARRLEELPLSPIFLCLTRNVYYAAVLQPALHAGSLGLCHRGFASCMCLTCMQSAVGSVVKTVRGCVWCRERDTPCPTPAS